MKILLKFAFLVVVTTVAFIAVSAVLPYSAEFQRGNENSDPLNLVYLLLLNAWICFTIVFVVKKAVWRRNSIMIGLIGTLFFTYSFMAQIETLFFGAAFKTLSSLDIILIGVANAVFIVLGVTLATWTFWDQKEHREPKNVLKSLPPWRKLVSGLLMIGSLYVVVYFIFGYFVAWQSEELRIFYSGSPEDGGFIASLRNNLLENPIIYPFQFLRGILYGVFVLPLVGMLAGKPKALLISLVLVFVSPGLGLIIPNFLFPDAVRWAHFQEMASSMSLFAVLVWLVYSSPKLSNSKEKKIEPMLPST